jgi:dolichol-phosphate mannosyltransferase
VIWNYIPLPIAEAISAELVVVMPIYNEAANIDKVIQEWIPALEKTGVPFAILALNDGSKDATAAKLAELEATYGDRLVVVNKVNSGHGPTCRLGYEIVAASRAQWMLQIDSDGQCNPEYFAEFWEKRQDADCVFGQRHSRDDGKARVVTSWICSNASSALCGVKLVDANVPYRLLRTEVLRKALKQIPANFNIHNVALTVVLKRLGDQVRWQYVPIHFRDRQGGSNSIDLYKVGKMGLGMLFDLAALK